jgi:two-component system response regulator RegX3
MRILIVEDEKPLRDGLTDLLKAARHEVEAVADGLSGLELAVQNPYDLVLLDLMLPGIDGLEICRRVRRTRPEQPILMLTARGSEDDKVAGFQAGADDYLAKPFGVRELLARVEAFERRAQTSPSAAEIVEAAGCSFDFGRHEARRGDQTSPLTPREVGILRWLHQHRVRAVSRSELLERVWGANGDLETRTVDMTIAKLRQKIEIDPAHPLIVVTVTGVGYAWGDRNAE